MEYPDQQKQKVSAHLSYFKGAYVQGFGLARGVDPNQNKAQGLFYDQGRFRCGRASKQWGGPDEERALKMRSFRTVDH